MPLSNGQTVVWSTSNTFLPVLGISANISIAQTLPTQKYYVKITAQGCEVVDSIVALYSKTIPQIDLESTILQCSNQLNVSANIDFYDNVIQHPYYSVIETFFLVDGVKPIAIVSAAYFKKNNKIGVTHYLGISQEYKGQKLGKYMILYALHYLRKNGFNQCEAESYLKYKESLGIHFNFGFKPKTKFENWNTFDNSNLISKILTKSELLKFYKNFYKNK